MELKTYFAQDAAGNIISSAIVNVFLQGTTTLATGLTRADGTPLENPFAADGAGRIQFRAPDGYYDVQVSAGPGIIQTLTIQCVDYSGAKADADRAEAAADRADVAADRADVSAEQAQNALNSITEINTNFEQNSREQWRRSLAEAGLTLVSGSFEEGATANSSTDAVWHISVGQCYTWDGAFPKAVPADSTPTSTGGIGPSAWLIVGDTSLRSDLSDVNSDVSIAGVSASQLVQNDIVDIGTQKIPGKQLHALQRLNLSKYAEKVARDSDTITIVCRGDSLTYGEDTIIAPTPPDTTPTASGRVHNKTRAATTYPQALQGYLQQAFSSSINVINQGYSGDNTKLGWGDWDVNVNSDLTIIMYGTNDAAQGFSPYQSISDYIFYYKKIIARELVKGAAVILITPPPQKQYGANVRLLDAYREAVFNIGEQYGIPVLDGVEVFYGIDSTRFSDNVHFREEGYKYLAAKVFSFLLSKFNNPTKVKSGTNINVRTFETSMKLKNGAWGTQLNKPSMVSPPLASYTGGYVVETSQYGNKVFICFYADEDDLIFTPSIIVANSTLSIELDFGLPQSQYSLDDRVVEIINSDITSKPSATLNLNVKDNTLSIDRNSSYDTQKSARIHIASRGWHVISMYINSNQSSGSPLLTIAGMSFLNYETQKLWDDRFFVRKQAQNPINNVVPRYIGEEYLDTTAGQFEWYKSTGLAAENWKKITNT